MAAAKPREGAPVGSEKLVAHATRGTPFLHRGALFVLAVGSIAALTGCGRSPLGQRGSVNPTAVSRWERVRDAAVGAAVEPGTWLPAAGALILYESDADRAISEWAVKYPMVYGAQNDAVHASDYIWTAMEAAYAASALTPRSGGAAGPSGVAGLVSVDAGAAAVVLNRDATRAWKSRAARLRPDEFDRKSFPSGHTSGVAVYAKLTSRNLDTLPLSESTKERLRLGLGLAVAATGWARVEAGAHFPSDVLAGAALGNFVGSFVSRAFLGADRPTDLRLGVEPSEDGPTVFLRWSF